VQVLRVDGTVVDEAVTASESSGDSRRVISAAETRFVTRKLGGDAEVIELAPYLLAKSGGKGPIDIGEVDGYPLGSPGLPSWIASAAVQGWEQVTVPAGSFRALRVSVNGRRSSPIGGRTAFAGRFEMTAWYAPDVKRIVRQEQKIWTSDGVSPTLYADEVLELLAYRPPP
jgi:hypothetical protein